jgi:hypothetical protein
MKMIDGGYIRYESGDLLTKPVVDKQDLVRYKTMSKDQIFWDVFRKCEERRRLSNSDEKRVFRPSFINALVDSGFTLQDASSSLKEMIEANQTIRVRCWIFIKSGSHTINLFQTWLFW